MSKQPKAGQIHDDGDPVWDAIINALFVGIVVAGFVLWCQRSKADDSAYLRARAAIAINASVTKTGGTDAAPSPVETAKPPAKAKPVVNLYSATWCAPCIAAKAELKAASKDLPFTVRIVDVSDGGQPGYVKSLPWVSWPKAEGEVWQRSYPGVKELVEQWQATSKATGSAAASSFRYTATTALYQGRQCTYPGEIRSHLRQSHGITAAEAAMLTREQAEQLHDALHEGYSVAQIRAWARARGMIK